jgi:hypothetical protein
MISAVPRSSFGQTARSPAPPTATQAQPTSTGPTTAAGVFLAVLRTQNHIKYSSSEKFQEAADAMEQFLKTNNVVLREDPVRGKFRVEGTMSRENEIRIAQDAGAAYVLQLVVDRPQTVWMALSMQCFDLQGTKLWEERGSAAGQLTASGHVQKAVRKLTLKLVPKLGSACLPVSASDKARAAQDKN